MMNYSKLFRYLFMIMLGGLGLFNSYKLEIRYETNTNLELICQNGMIISTLVILYFTLAFAAEVLVTTKNKITDSSKEITLLKNEEGPKAEETYEFVGPVKSLSDDDIGAQEFYVRYSDDETDKAWETEED